MKNLVRIFILIILNIFVFICVSFASVRFLEEAMMMSARGTSLGGAYCGVVDAVDGVLVNPAVLHYVVYPELSFMYKKGLMDSYYSFVGFSYPMRSGGIGVTCLVFDGGDIEVNYLDAGTKKIKLEQDAVVSIACGMGFYENFFYGVNLKFIYSQLAEEYKAIGSAVDFGLLLRSVDNKISLGASLTNLGTVLRYYNIAEELCGNLRFGVAFNLLERGDVSILLAADAQGNIRNIKATGFLYNFGLEARLYRIAYLRLGYKTSSSSALISSLGFGLSIFSCYLDYAYLPLPSVDEITHQLSLSLKFGSGKVYDVAEKYYKKGMKERAYVLLKKLKPTDRGYFVAQKKMEEIGKEIADKHVKVGKEFFDKSDWLTAMRKFEEALKYDPQSHDAKQLLMAAKINKDDEDRKLLAKKYFKRAQRAAEREAWDEAIKLWKQVLELEPANTDAQRQLTAARILKKKKMYSYAPMPPEIVKFNPTRAATGMEIEIIGNNFDLDEEANEVLFDNIFLAKIVKAEKNKLIVRVPNVSKVGPIPVKVRTYGGDSTTKYLYVVPPGKPPLLKIANLSFLDANGDKILSAEESGKIVFDVENASGAGKGFGLVAKVTPLKNTDIKLTEAVNIGDIEPGEKKTVEIGISAGIDVPNSDLAINIKIDEATGFNPEPKQIVFKTEAIKPPKVEIAKIEIDDKFYPDRIDKLSVGNGDGIIQPGESVEVILTVVNKGPGATRNSLASVTCYSDEVSFRSKITGIELGNIMPGEWREVRCVFGIPKTYSGPEVLKFSLKILDDRAKFNKELPFELTLGKRYEKMDIVKIEAAATAAAEAKPIVIPTFGNELLILPVVQQRFISRDAVGVIVGIKGYKHKDVPEVEYALRDASLVKEYFVSVIGIPKENIIYLENPTQGDFVRVFGTKEDYRGELYNYIKPDKSEVFIYYTGHGAPDIETRSAYFVPSDCHPNYVKLNGYSLDLFYENLSKIPARSMTVIIDACFSGASERGMLIAKASPLMVAPITGKFVKNMNIFTSASGEEISSWYPEKGHGLFTYFFLRALQGEADSNRDKNLTFGEIEDYVKENVSFLARKMYGRKQTPKFIGDRDKVIVKY